MAESRVKPSIYPENSMVALVLKVKVIPMSFRKSRARKLFATNMGTFN